MFHAMKQKSLPHEAQDAAEDSGSGVIAVRRAMRVLEAFGMDNAQLTLAELSRRTGFHRSTVLRLARTLSADSYLVQKEDGSWRLGRSAGWLGACYQATFDVYDVVEPALRELAIQTGESASFYVREGHQRTCVVRVEGPQAVRHHIRIGAALPLDCGGPGRVILAFSGEPGEPYESIRQRGYQISLGERDPEVSSVSAPVFGFHWKLLGSICISGPISRLSEATLLGLAPTVVGTANQLSYAMAGTHRPAAKPGGPATWHP